MTEGIGVVVDSRGNVIAMGGAAGPIDLGSGPVGPAIDLGFITERSAQDGSELWSIVLAGDVQYAFGECAGIAVDAADDVICAGDYGGAVDFGGTTLGTDPPLGSTAFLAKYDHNGHLLWVKNLQTVVIARAIALGADGTTFLVGDNAGAQPQQVVSYVIAYDPNGQQLWLKQFAGAELRAIAVMPDGDIVTTGDIGAAVSFGGPTLAPASYVNAVIASFHPDGGYTMSRVIGSPTAVSEAGEHVVATPSQLAMVDVNDSPLSTDTLYAFDDQGTEQWSDLITSGAHGNWTRGLPLLPDGDVASLQWFSSPYDADHPESITGDMQVATFDPTGREGGWSFGQEMLGSPGGVSVQAAASSPDGKLAVTGYVSGGLDFGFGPVVATGQAMFLVVVDASPVVIEATGI